MHAQGVNAIDDCGALRVVEKLHLFGGNTDVLPCDSTPWHMAIITACYDKVACPAEIAVVFLKFLFAEKPLVVVVVDERETPFMDGER